MVTDWPCPHLIVINHILSPIWCRQYFILQALSSLSLPFSRGPSSCGHRGESRRLPRNRDIRNWLTATGMIFRLNPRLRKDTEKWGSWVHSFKEIKYLCGTSSKRELLNTSKFYCMRKAGPLVQPPREFGVSLSPPIRRGNTAVVHSWEDWTQLGL